MSPSEVASPDDCGEAVSSAIGRLGKERRELNTVRSAHFVNEYDPAF